jgi:hypothetical protein
MRFSKAEYSSADSSSASLRTSGVSRGSIGIAISLSAQ